MIRYFRTRTSPLPRTARTLLISICAIFALFSLLSKRTVLDAPKEAISKHVFKQSRGAYRIPKGPLPSVNLVVAATSKEDYSWVKELRVPGMVVVPYIADNESAPHHPLMNKGNEAMIYHQYFYDFYDKLPDISILIHSQQQSWHVETLLDQSMIFSLNHLDLREIQRREFVNLRVTWGFGCTNGAINTTRVNEESGTLPEQKEMQEAFRANFNLYDIPEILATPCCSQIAVTKERILSISKEQYKHHIEWLMKTDLENSISGRTWEHMWQYLFLQRAIDCPIEHIAYCRLYHICFGGREEYDEWIELQQGREKLENELKKMDESDKMTQLRIENKRKEEEAMGKQEDEKEKERERSQNEAAQKSRAKTKEWLLHELVNVQEAIRVRREIAVVRGAVKANRDIEGEALYGDESEPGAEKDLLPSTTRTTDLMEKYTSVTVI